MESIPVIREFLQQLLMRKGDSAGFSDIEGLLVSGRMDSVDVIEVVVFLENTFAIDFSQRAFDQSEFDSVNSIAALVNDWQNL